MPDKVFCLLVLNRISGEFCGEREHGMGTQPADENGDES